MKITVICVYTVPRWYNFVTVSKSVIVFRFQTLTVSVNCGFHVGNATPKCKNFVPFSIPNSALCERGITFGLTMQGALV